MRVRSALLVAGAAVVLAIAGWWVVPKLPRTLAGWLERTGEVEVAHVSVEDVQALVRRTLPAVGLEAEDLLEESSTERSDARGAWRPWNTRWRLSEGEDAEATGRRLASLVGEERGDLEAYVVEAGTGAAEVRVYGGSRLAARLLLEPTLPDWPEVPAGARPLLAIVLDGVDRDPHASSRFLDVQQPLAVALSPYSPYTLRMARDAVTRHKEVLARVEPDTTPAEALEAVPHATGALFGAPPRGDPDVQAAAMRDQGVYAVDGVGLPAAWIRALKDAGVPVVRASRSWSEGPDLKAFRARAAREGSGVLVLDVDGSVTAEALASLAEAPARGFRPAFVAEVVQAPPSP